MRPLNITIEGFGTYYKKTFIDFEKFGKQGLYLITGDTGSGKTTIFDAISYALFGGASGDVRDNKMFRSSLSTLDDPTYVELNFSFKDKKYYVRRNPSYERNMKKGNGVTTENSSAILKDENGTVLENQDKAVTEKIESILGIDKEQFCQISMIAQGNFQKIIFGESKNRLEIFRTLFCTEKYEQLQKALKESLHDKESKKEECEKLLKSHFNNIICSPSNENYDDINEAKNNEISWNEKFNLLKSIIKSDEEEKNKITTLLNENNKELDKIKIKREEIKFIGEKKEKLASLEKEIEEKNKSVENLTDTVTVRKEAYDNIPLMTEEKSNIKKEIEKYEQLEQKEQECFSLNKECASLAEKIEQYKKSNEDTVKDIKDKEEKLLELNNCDIEKEKVSNQKEKLEERKVSIDCLIKEEDEISDLKLKIEKSQKEYLNASKKYESALLKYTSLNKAFLDGQAGILAKTLKENEKCPVCGSLHHPSPCCISDKVPDEKELKDAKAEEEKLDKTAREKSEKAASNKAKLEEKKNHFVSSFNSLFKEQSFDEETASSIIADEKKSIDEKIDDNKKLLEQIKKNISSKEKYEKDVLEGKKLLEKYSSLINENEKIVVKKEAEKESLEKFLSEEKEKLLFKDIKEAKAKLSEYERKIDIAKKSYEDAVKKLDKAKNELNIFNGRKTEIEKTINNSSNIDVKKIEEEYLSLEEKNEQYTKENEDVISRLKVNIQVNEYLEKHICEIEKLKKDYEIIKPLSDTANGELLKKARLYLETYVQKTYFRKVLYYANTRLLIMTDGQYELVEKEKNNRVNISGLDIDVKDHWNGKIRSVKTLSGGESFQASLALALGLSDAVSSFAGGVSIDTMFIDEGFGSLDSEALQKAFKALTNLSQTDKLIGIISHVSALQDKIDRQIVVKKTRDTGSFVNIVS